MSRHEALAAPERTFENLLKLSPLYSLGLIDDAFLEKPLSADSSRFFAKLLDAFSRRSDHSLSTFILEQSVLTKSDFLNHATEHPLDIEPKALAMMLFPEKKQLKELSYIVEQKILTTSTLWNRFLIEGSFFNFAFNRGEFDWKHIIDSRILRVEEINGPNSGFDAIEVNALMHDLLTLSPKSHSYPLDKKAHPLVQRMRGQENTKQMSSQVERVLGPKGRGNVLEDFTQVFDFYLPKAPLFSELKKRERVSAQKRERVRRKNITSVNNNQQRQLKNKNPHRDTPEYDPSKRHFDIYARYGHGQMDPLQLAFISKTAEWYIMGGRSQLFNNVRIVPYRKGFRGEDEQRMPYVAQVVCEGSEMLEVEGWKFRDSMMGANRMFLTHSASREATEMGSVPVIGLSTAQNISKRSSNPDDYVVFNAFFDPKDRGWRAPETKEGYGVNGDIAGLINETLRTMVEVENIEIARAEAALEEMEEAEEAEKENATADTAVLQQVA